MTSASAHHAEVRLFIVLLSLLGATPAAAIDRIELQIGRIDGPGWQLSEIRGEWQREGRVRLAAVARDERLPGPLHAALDCGRLRTQAPLGCESLRLRARLDPAGSLDATASLQFESAASWQLRLDRAELKLQYNSDDGRLAAENLQLRLSGEGSSRGGTLGWSMQAHTEGGLAYVEPYFVDFSAWPLALDTVLRHDGTRLWIERLRAQQHGLGTLSLHGSVDPRSWASEHQLSAEAQIDDAAAATALYVQPAVAATALQGLALEGRLNLKAEIHNARPSRIDAGLAQLAVVIPGFGTSLDGLSGNLAWNMAEPARASQLQWTGGHAGRLPIGQSRLQFEAVGTALALTAPAQIPLLDGSIDVARLALSGIGNDLQAEFAADLQPIDLRGLCRALGWPEFSGTLAGSIPGLHLRDRLLELDGALSASAFGGDIHIGALSVIDPFGVLPRVSADIRLRRLDLAAVTGAFDFGRITGRLDGDIEGLRLIGWEPVAMDAHLYSTPDDRSRKRISQRAIDNISAVGGGPTGLLSRGVMRFFDDFAYRRIGWRCVLDNDVCRMDGIRASDEGDGYVLVQGWGLPRIDVVGFSRRVSWPVFMSQLRNIGKTGPARIDGP